MNTYTDSFENLFGNKQRILVVMAHPDDAEVMSGGTIARLTTAGKEVRVVKVTRGNKGSRQEVVTEAALTQERTTEDQNSMSILGIKPENQIFLDISDGSVDNSHETIGKIALQIRLFKPDIIITHNPEDVIIKFDNENNWVNHRDHRNTALSTVDAAYPYSRDLLFFPEHFAIEGAASHQVTEFLFVDFYNREDVIGIDVTDFLIQRTQATASHTSQYTQEKAQGTTDFLTIPSNDRRFEVFRYVKID